MKHYNSPSNALLTHRRNIWKGIVTMFLLLGISILTLPVTAPLRASDPVLCPYDRPCITDLYISTSNALIARVNGSGWDAINVRWSRPGREGRQTEHPGRNGGIRVLTGTTPGVVYTVSVQGCNKRVLQSSRCTDWHTFSKRAY